jgi:hypothetical protein
MSSVLEFIFESTATCGWVPALGSSRHVNGAIASQNAGSIIGVCITRSAGAA